MFFLFEMYQIINSLILTSSFCKKTKNLPNHHDHHHVSCQSSPQRTAQRTAGFVLCLGWCCAGMVLVGDLIFKCAQLQYTFEVISNTCLISDVDIHNLDVEWLWWWICCAGWWMFVSTTCACFFPLAGIREPISCATFTCLGLSSELYW